MHKCVGTRDTHQSHTLGLHHQLWVGIMYAFLYVLQATYKQLEGLILQGQEGKPHYSLLQESFVKLSFTTAVAKTNTRQQKILFCEQMNQVLLEVKGFLCII